MTNKEKIVKRAGIWATVSKVLYIICCVLCVIYVALAIALPLAVKSDKIPPMEFCAVFVDLALTAFFAIALFWNMQMLFKNIKDEQTPFASKLAHYMQKIGIFVILMCAIPGAVATAIVQGALPDNELVFGMGVGGIICGIVLIVVSKFFAYGSELQQKEDETL